MWLCNNNKCVYDVGVRWCNNNKCVYGVTVVAVYILRLICLLLSSWTQLLTERIIY